jgi:RNA polymerase sigma-70 factor (ECF subfamily)
VEEKDHPEVGTPDVTSGSQATRPSDEELARRAQGGCTASFEELARRLQVPLLGYLRRWVSVEDAEDLVQDALVRAYQNLHRYRPSWRFATWLFTIARRLCINLKRRKHPKANGELLEAVQDDAPGPAQLAGDEESRRCLWGLAAEVLSEPQMTATWLYYVEGMSVSQVARVLRSSKTGAKVTLYRARKKLMPVLRRLEPAASAGPGNSSGHVALC